MKKIFCIVLAAWAIQSANALIVRVNGKGEIPEEGLDLLVSEGEENPLTGVYTMELRGDFLTSAAQITVTISRSANGMEDEFCCGINCTAGNKETNEVKTFNVSGLTKWYLHYSPALGSDETVRYLFNDGTESRELRVRYVYSAEGTSEVQSGKTNTAKTLHNGQVLIRCGEKEYNITGKQL